MVARKKRYSFVPIANNALRYYSKIKSVQSVYHFFDGFVLNYVLKLKKKAQTHTDTRTSFYFFIQNDYLKVKSKTETKTKTKKRYNKNITKNMTVEQHEIDCEYISAACNRTLNSLDWGGVNNQLVYAFGNSIALLTSTEPFEVKRSFNKHVGRVNCLKWIVNMSRQHDDLNEFVSGSTDKTLIVWRGTNCQLSVSSDQHLCYTFFVLI